jgi:hypothetical protein
MIFELHNTQLVKASEFVSKHNHSKQYTITFTLPGGFGIIEVLKCSMCNEELDLTDMDLW